MPSNGTIFAILPCPVTIVSVSCRTPFVVGAKVIASLQLFPTDRSAPGAHVERDASRVKSEVELMARLMTVTGALLLFGLITSTNFSALVWPIFTL